MSSVERRHEANLFTAKKKYLMNDASALENRLNSKSGDVFILMSAFGEERVVYRKVSILKDNK